MHRYLFGPINGVFSEQLLGQARREGHCRSFNIEGGTDHSIPATATWTEVIEQMPGGWRPDAVCVWLGYTHVPEWVWTAPIPVIGLAPDWSVLWHYYRLAVPHCDLVLTDQPGVERFHASGINHVEQAYLFGLSDEWWTDQPSGELLRDIDVCFVGNFNPAVHVERARWLGRLARHAPKWKVIIRVGVFGSDYRALLRRSRIVFNHSLQNQCNARAFEAIAAGSLLFNEAGSDEVNALLAPGRDYVAYNVNDFDEQLEHYLVHDDKRRPIAQSAAIRAQELSFARLWSDRWSRIESNWEDLVTRCRHRRQVSQRELVFLQAHQLASRAATLDPLTSEVASLLVDDPQSAPLHHLLAGLASAPAPAAASIRRALDCDPQWVMGSAALAETSAVAGERERSIQEARNGLTQLARMNRLPGNQLHAFVRPDYHRMHLAWEECGWQNADDQFVEGSAKARWLRWRLHLVLAELTGEIGHYHEAALANSKDSPTFAALGCALARASRPVEAITHLRKVETQQPFDMVAARALFHLLGQIGDGIGQRQLARNLRSYATAAPQLVSSEPWFEKCPPPGDELVSVIIACHNNLEDTRRCVDSLFRYTRGPCELVFIDNGSTDETCQYLDGLLTGDGIVRVEVIHNSSNRGFPAACNQGLMCAQGDYVVFLNNDTVVTPGWLDGLIRWSLVDWPHIGLVGAVTNAAPEPQFVPATYGADLAGLAEFASRRRSQFAGQALDVQRISGFCLLTRRDVLQRVGGFDERFGMGFFDDDDLGIRVREAGYKLVVALDTFVHHVGSRTFLSLGINTEELLWRNLQLFREKWGAERAAGYRTQDSRSVTAPAAPLARLDGQVRISLCMIVRNEEDNLPDCLDSVEGIFHETVVVDTGSTDRTREIALARGAKVVEFPWCDDFSAARNVSADNATGDYIFWMDADDRLDPTDRSGLVQLLSGLAGENCGYVLKCVCTSQGHGQSPTVVDHLRLFRNRPEHRWKYRVHEQILPSLRGTGAEVRFSDLRINHVGYQDPALRRRKLDRDLNILQAESALQPDDPFTLFNLGSVYQEMGRLDEAIPILRKSLQRSHPADSIVRKLYALIAGCHRRLDQSDEALDACIEGRKVYPEDTELLFLEGALRRERGDNASAESCWLSLLGRPEANHFASIDAGLRGPKARHNLAVLYLEQNRFAEAEAQWRAALCEDRDFLGGWLGLGELYLKRKDWSNLSGVINQLEGEGSAGLAPEAGLLRARMYLARKEFAAARWVLSELINANPSALEPRVILTHVFLLSWFSRKWTSPVVELWDPRASFGRAWSGRTMAL